MFHRRCKEESHRLREDLKRAADHAGSLEQQVQRLQDAKSYLEGQASSANALLDNLQVQLKEWMTRALDLEKALHKQMLLSSEKFVAEIKGAYEEDEDRVKMIQGMYDNEQGDLD